jgi:septal ring factor EnvC (AmiA/AmiB activator)
MLFPALAIWGCMPELTKNCVDMTNASSTYLSLGLGAIIGAVVSWWIYNMQKKTSMKQDETLRRINQLEESHDKVLKSIQHFQQHQEKLLSKILSLDKKIDAIVDTDKENELY